MDERKAIRRIKQGDIRGLEFLVRTYQVQAVRAAYLIVRDHTLAEDIVQAAFLRAYERFDQFDPERPFGPWFLRSVVNDAIKGAARRERLVPLESDNEEGEGHLAELLADSGPEPADAAERAELREMVWAALGQLAPEQRATIVLRYYLGLGEAEIADRMTCPAGTVKWRLHAARNRLRVLLHSLRPEA